MLDVVIKDCMPKFPLDTSKLLSGLQVYVFIITGPEELKLLRKLQKIAKDIQKNPKTMKGLSSLLRNQKEE